MASWSQTRMKTMFPVVRCTLCLALVVAFSACQKKASEPSASEAEQPAATPPPVAATATPAPAPAPAPESAPAAPATPAPPRLAPPGVYFLVTAVTVATDAGVTGLPPGTRVVRQPDGRFLANGQQIALRPEQITNDLNVAEKVASTDRAAQASIRQTLAPSRPAATPAAAATPKRKGRFDPDPAEEARNAQYAALEKRLNAKEVELGRLRDELGKLSNQDPKRSPAAYRLHNQINALEAEARQIRDEHARVR